MIRVLEGISLPDLIRTQLTHHLARLDHAEDLHALEQAQECAQGFVEGVEASRALTAASIEVLFILIDDAVSERRQELTT